MAAVALAACASPTANVPRNYVLSQANGTGMVIGTITSSGDYADYRIEYRRIGGRGDGFFNLHSVNPEFNGALIAAELPAGDYEIYRWRIIMRTAYENSETMPDTPFSIPFRVEPGQATYIGSCDFSLYVPLVTCRDRVERDFMEFEMFYPLLSSMLTPPQSGRGQFYTSEGFRTKSWTRDGGSYF